MNELAAAELQKILSAAQIAMADPERGVGRELTFPTPPARTLVVHLAESDTPDYVSRVVSIILAVEESWLLIPRHGSASQIGLPTVRSDVAAFEFTEGERGALCGYLCTRDTSLSSASSDLYAVSIPGNTIVTWDHHTADEGLIVESRDVQQTGRLLMDLNAVGTEFEVFYTDGY